MPNDKLQKLQELIKLANDGLSKQDFLDNFKLVVDYIKKIEANLTANIDEKTKTAEEQLAILKIDYEAEIQKVKNETIKLTEENKTTIPNIKKWAMQKISELFLKSNVSAALTDRLNEFDLKLEEVDKRIAEINDFTLPDASTLAVEASKLAQEALLPLIPVKEPLMAKNADLEAEEELEIKSIKGLKEIIDGLKRDIISSRTIHALGTSGGGRICKAYDLSDQLNGVTKIFNLPAMWRIISVQLSSVPNVLRPTVDYVYDASAHTITFTSEINADTSLATGQTCVLTYSE